MLLTICAGGKARNTPFADLYADYESRINQVGPRLGLGPCALREIDTRKKTFQRPGRNADPFLAAADGSDRLIILDEGGRSLTSRKFADTLGGLRDQGVREAAFLIGDADGLSDTVKAAAHITLCFGTMTWPHLMARAMLAEQIYRALCILDGHPYHHG